MIVYTARHMLPVVAQPVTDAAIAIDEGRITAAGRRKDVLKAVAQPEIRDLGDSVVIPGLVNAHLHLELSWMGEQPPAADDYVGWIRALVAQRGARDAAAARDCATRAIEGMIARGTVAVGDVANEGWTAPLLARSGVSGVIFLEIFGFRAADAESILEAAARRLDEIDADPDVRAARDRMRVVLTPHAPHSTSGSLLRALGGRAAATGEPLAIHVAESEAELALLRDGSGPFADFLRERGVWDEGWRAPGLSPVDFLDRLGLLGPRTLAVHVVHVTHNDIAKLQGRGVTVVTCPRSNQTLGVGIAPVPKLLASGIPVAIGTDSLASSPDLDLLSEIAALRECHPTLAPAAALRMATYNGARALGCDRDYGGIDKGRSARLVVVPLDDPAWDPLEVVTWNPPEVYTLESAPWAAHRA